MTTKFRTKTIEIDGTKFTIAPLNMEQVEHILNSVLTDEYSARDMSWEVIMHSLTNAGSEIPLPELKRSLSFDGFDRLGDEVLIISKMRRLQPGESQAAPDSTSPTSEAAL